MNVSLRFVASGIALVVGFGMLVTSSPAKGQGGGRFRQASMSGAVANPLYTTDGTGGENPLYEPHLRFSLGGGTSLGEFSPVVQYSVDIVIGKDDWDGQQFIHKEKIVHRDIAARNFMVSTIDVISTPKGVDISINRGPRQTVSMDGSFSPNSRISTNMTVERQTPKRDFGDRMVVQSFTNDSNPQWAFSVPFQE